MRPGLRVSATRDFGGVSGEAYRPADFLFTGL
jgi:hypothetical protein